MSSLNLSSYRRIRTVEFLSAQSQATAVGALFATDLAARGMDFEPSLAWRQMVVSDKNAPNHTFWDVAAVPRFEDVHTVIQVGFPEDREQYVHRAGRTGRPVRKQTIVLKINET